MNYKMMMNENSSNSTYEAKQEEDDDEEMMKTNNFTKTQQTPTSRQWTSLRNPRIVRVSRSLGGKDRHSKVCTIRGLRDRRIRLSVPTAVQLYDLQDRLGLNQPSKVVDWLLEVTKSDIDKLPPLDFPHHIFHQQQTLLPLPMPMPPHHQESASSTSFSLGAFYDANNQNLMSTTKSRFWDVDSVSRLKGKEAENLQENQSAAPHKLFQDTPRFPNNALTTYNSSYHMDPSSLSLSQFGSNLFPSSGSAMQFSSSLSGSQLLFCPSSSATSSSLFGQHAQFMSNSSVESDPRQSNHIRFLSSTSQHGVTPLGFVPPLGRHSVTPFSSKLLDSDNNNDMGSASRS